MVPIKTETLIGITAIAALVALPLLKKAVALGTLQFFPDKVTQLSFDGATPVMTMGLLTQNSSAQDFNIRSISGSVYANGYLVGNISEFGLIPIAPNSEGTIYVKCRFLAIGIVNDIIRAFQFGNFGQTLTLDGFVNIDNYQVPLNMDFQIGSPQQNAA